MRIRLVAAVAATAFAGVVLAACGGGSSGSGSSGGTTAKAVTATVDGAGTFSTDQTLAAKVPSAFRSKGSLVVATNAPYAPFIDFKSKGDQDHFVGLDYDLFVAAGAKLGLTVTFQQQPFDGLVPGLQAGKYDAIAGGITDKKEREQVATFVDYTASGTGFLVATGNPKGVTDVSKLCGLRVAAQKASNQASHLTDYSKTSCGAAHIDVKEYPANTDAVQALIAGQVDAVAATKVNLIDVVTQLPGKVELVADSANPNGWLASPNGFGFLKANSELAGAFQAALQAMVADGSYSKILDHWKQQTIAIATITVDKAIG